MKKYIIVLILALGACATPSSPQIDFDDRPFSRLDTGAVSWDGGCQEEDSSTFIDVDLFCYKEWQSLYSCTLHDSCANYQCNNLWVCIEEHGLPPGELAADCRFE